MVDGVVANIGTDSGVDNGVEGGGGTNNEVGAYKISVWTKPSIITFLWDFSPEVRVFIGCITCLHSEVDEKTG